jgi:hypothetical protein
MVRKRQFNYTTKDGQAIKAGLNAKYDQITNVLEGLNVRKDELAKRAEMRFVVDDVAKGLYEEIDKQFKKSPVEPVTMLTVTSVNQVIADTKEIAISDPYIQRITAFEPAGDNPETRDVALTLNQLLKGLERMTSSFKGQMEKLKTQIRESELLNEVLEQIVKFDLELEINDLDNGEEFSDWFLDEDGQGYNYFDYEKLCQTDFVKYFGNVE